MNLRFASCLAIPLITLSACGSDSGTISTDDGDVEYSVTGEEGARHVELNGKDGVKSVDSGADIAPDLPKGIATYPDAKIVNVTNVGMTGKASGAMVSMASDDKPDAVVGWYKTQAKAAGFAIDAEVTTGDLRIVSGKAPDGREFSVTATPADPGSAIQLIAGENL